MRNPYREQIQPNPTRDRRTLVVLVASTVVLGGFLMYSMFLAGGGSEPIDHTPFTEENDWGGDLRDRLGYEEISIPAGLESQIRERNEAERLLKDKEPFNYLLGEVADRPFRFFNEVGYTNLPGEITTEEILTDPDLHRARQFAVKGTLIALEMKPLDLPAPLIEVWRGVIRIDGEEGTEPSYVAFENVESLSRVRVGDIAVLYGVFFKSSHFAVDDDVHRGDFVDGPLMIGRRIKRSYEYLDVQDLDPNIARRVKDQEPLDKMVIEDEVFFHLASYAKNLDVEKVRTETVEDSDMLAAYQFPARFRGQMMKFRGTLVLLEKVKLEDNPAGLDAYYDGILHSMDRVHVRVRFVNKPTNVVPGDLVAVRGLFMKVHKYEARSEDSAPEVPLLIGVSIDPIEFRDETLRDISLVLGIMAGGLLLVFSISLFVGRKSSQAFQEAHWERKKRRFEKMAAPPTGEGGH